MSETKKQYSVKFPAQAAEVLDDMAKEECVSVAELLRRAVNFYEVKLDAKRNHKQIILEREGGVRERLIL
jgi:hypothetical protein